VPPCEPLPLLERFENEPLFLRPHSTNRPDASVLRGRLEIVDGANAQLAIEHSDRLRADALQVQKIENGRRKLGDERAMVRGVAGLGDLADARREILADARNLTEPR